jgi:hypothetical protein
LLGYWHQTHGVNKPFSWLVILQSKQFLVLLSFRIPVNKQPQDGKFLCCLFRHFWTFCPAGQAQTKLRRRFNTAANPGEGLRQAGNGKPP